MFLLKFSKKIVSGFNMLAALILEVMDKQESESLQVSFVFLFQP